MVTTILRSAHTASRAKQTHHATVHSSLVAEAWCAWHSMPARRRRGLVKIRPTHGCFQQHMQRDTLAHTATERHGLQLTEIHDVIAANSAIVYNDVPCPQRNLQQKPNRND